MGLFFNKKQDEHKNKTTLYLSHLLEMGSYLKISLEKLQMYLLSIEIQKREQFLKNHEILREISILIENHNTSARNHLKTYNIIINSKNIPEKIRNELNQKPQFELNLVPNEKYTSFLNEINMKIDKITLYQREVLSQMNKNTK